MSLYAGECAQCGLQFATMGITAYAVCPICRAKEREAKSADAAAARRERVRAAVATAADKPALGESFEAWWKVYIDGITDAAIAAYEKGERA